MMEAHVALCRVERATNMTSSRDGAAVMLNH
jgi:hypothetical protein